MFENSLSYIENDLNTQTCCRKRYENNLLSYASELDLALSAQSIL